jgi:hypothetical protein
MVKGKLGLVSFVRFWQQNQDGRWPLIKKGSRESCSCFTNIHSAAVQNHAGQCQCSRANMTRKGFRGLDKWENTRSYTRLSVRPISGCLDAYLTWGMYEKQMLTRSDCAQHKSLPMRNRDVDCMKGRFTSWQQTVESESWKSRMSCLRNSPIVARHYLYNQTAVFGRCYCW